MWCRWSLKDTECNFISRELQEKNKFSVPINVKLPIFQVELQQLQAEKEARLPASQSVEENSKAAAPTSETVETIPESAYPTPTSVEATPEAADNNPETVNPAPETAETSPQATETPPVVSIVTASGVKRDYLYDYTQWFAPVVAEDGVTYYQSTEGHVSYVVFTYHFL